MKNPGFTYLLFSLAFIPFTVIAEDKRIEVSLKATSHNGETLPNAKIQFFRWNYNGVDPRKDPIHFTTNENGEWTGQLPAGNYQYVVKSGDSVNLPGNVIYLRTGKEPYEIDTKLSPGGYISGRITDMENGAPIADALCVAGNSDVAFSDKEGNYRIGPLPFGEVILKFRKAGLGDRKIAVNSSSDSIEQKLDVALAKGWQVTGVVTDQTGKPISNAKVGDNYSGKVIHCLMNDVLTDSEGRYSLGWYPLDSPIWSFDVSHPEFAKQSVQDFDPPDSGDSIVLDFQLDKGYAVTGTITDAEGKPVENASVYYKLSKSHVHAKRTTTDQSGKYHLTLIHSPANERILVEAKDFAPAIGNVSPGKAPDIPTLDFQLQKGAVIQGKVITEDGKPVPDVWLSARWDTEY